MIGLDMVEGRATQIEGYAVIVPFVEESNEIFLKTAFPSRKYTKRYGLKGEL
ncbi:MAG: hypothetical protein HY881_21630 [Deltaproteobacteria bacterium]|nr:hypothetical protein [Deltaproteobacteria bacterium]